MKIINASKLFDDDSLAIQIKELEQKIGLSRHCYENMPTHIQRAYLMILQDFVDYHFSTYNHGFIEDMPREEESLTEQNCLSNFPRFGDLPGELRLNIYELCFIPELGPKIHCIDERTSKVAKRGAKFISNQPISPFLHVCEESRAHYLFVSKACFAFETFINFSIDTIYIPDFASREEQFPRFLECESAEKIVKLAMRKDFYCNLPGREIMWHRYVDMVYALPQWKELTCVFNDNSSRAEVWQKRDLSFRDLSARQKRSGPGACERGFARLWASVLNSISTEIGLGQIHYRFAVPENF